MMREISFVQAIKEALQEEMRRDERIFLMGEDVRLSIFGTTKGLLGEFGAKRVRNTPITEAAFIGAAVGASATGTRPVVDLMTSNFCYKAMDEFANQAAKMRYMFGEQASLPVVFLASCGAFGSAAAQHSDSPYPIFMNLAGIKVVVPSNPKDAKGLLKSSIRDDNPVFFFEPTALLAGDKGPVPEEEYLIPLSQAEIKRAGSHVTVVAIGEMVRQALSAAKKLSEESIEIEVVDPRTLYPLDSATILESVKKTGRVVIADGARRTCGAAAEIAAIVSQEGFRDLRAPIYRVTTPDVPVPFCPPLEKYIVPDAESIAAAVQAVCNYS